jgi:hypothetical protein
MHLGNATNDALDNRNEIGPPFGKASDTVSAVVTFDVITEADETLVSMLL